MSMSKKSSGQLPLTTMTGQLRRQTRYRYCWHDLELLMRGQGEARSSDL